MPNNLKISVHEAHGDFPLTHYKRTIETLYDRFVVDAVDEISRRMGIKATDPEYDDVWKYVESVISGHVGK